MNLTRRQEEILEHLRLHQEEGGPPPTLDELCVRLGLRSRGSLHKHIQALVAAGRVEPLHGQQRGVRLTTRAAVEPEREASSERGARQGPDADPGPDPKPAPDPAPDPLTEQGPTPPDDQLLPLLGRIAAGRPIEAVAEPEQIEVPSHLRTDRPCYVLQVSGDSLCDAGILDGDYVVIEHRDQARNGEIVVALIRGEEATLKRIVQAPGRVLLRPENSAMEDMEYHPDEVQIQGVLVGQMRRYR